MVHEELSIKRRVFEFFDDIYDIVVLLRAAKYCINYSVFDVYFIFLLFFIMKLLILLFL